MPKARKTVRKRRLRDLNDCVRAASWLFNGLARDEIEPQKAGKLAFILNTQKSILQVIQEQKQLSELSERLEKIEAKLDIAN